MAQIGGKPERVKLNTDLTRYDSRLTTGQMGTTIPNTKLSVWGSMDTFVAVKFDCGAKLDILYSSLEFSDEYKREQETNKRKELEELKSAENIEVTYGPQGGFKYLHYEYYGKDGIHRSVGNGFKKESEELIGYFKSMGKEIKTEYLNKK